MEDIDKYEILDNNREVSQSEPMINMRPIDEVKIILNGIVKDISTVKSDMAVIKNRLYELQNEVGLRQRENRLLKEEKCQSRGWFY